MGSVRDGRLDSVARSSLTDASDFTWHDTAVVCRKYTTPGKTKTGDVTVAAANVEDLMAVDAAADTD